MEFKARKGTKLWLGNYLVVLPANQTIDFVGANSLDDVAGILASHKENYALNLAALTHTENIKKPGRKPVTLHVSYDANGGRVESNPEEVKAQVEEQKRNVAQADKAFREGV